MIVKNMDINYTYEGYCKVSLILDKNINIGQLEELKSHTDNGKLLDATIKKYRKKRSINANSYMWILLQKISEKLNSSKEEIYINIIKRVGQFEIVPIKNESAEHWINTWNSRGIGWYSEELRNKLEGYITTINYYGTSVYNSKEMYIVINEIVEEAKNLNIETMTPEEINLMIGDN